MTTINYTISNVTADGDKNASVTYTLSHSGTGLSQDATQDFLASLLTANITSNMDAGQRQDQIKTNFLSLIGAALAAFVVRVNNAQAQQDAMAALIGGTGTFTSSSTESTGLVLPLHGSVSVDLQTGESQ